MQEQLPLQERPFFTHDGSSQAGRVLKALDPDYVLVDERSLRDLLRFAQDYAKQLNYFEENDRPDGSWSGFLGDQPEDLDQILAFLQNPQKFQDDAQAGARLSRPHLVLFLTFLELLQHARAQLNDLTRRHLEFYYREALRLTSRQGSPDRVHVLVELADRQDQFLLPAGTRFQAGEDALGQPLFYKSEDDLVANHAAVAEVKTLFAAKRVIGLHEVRQDPDLLIELFPQDEKALKKGKQADRSFMAMLRMALGTPDPGEELEPYPGGYVVDPGLLDELDKLLDFVPSVLYMPFSSFRMLIDLKDEQTRAYETDWTRVNEYLETAGQRRDPGFELVMEDPADFEQNFLTVLGCDSFTGFFDELPEVQDIYDLHRRLDRDYVLEFIRSSLHMKIDETVNEFRDMMAIVETINARWRQIYELLRSAGRKKQLKNPAHRLSRPQIRTYEPDKFDVLLRSTLGEVEYPGLQLTRSGSTQKQIIQLTSLDDVYAEILKLESYFHLSAEQFVLIRDVNSREDRAQPWEWQQVYDVLAEAHSERSLSARREAFKESLAAMKAEGLEAMLLFSVGDAKPGDPLPESKEFKELDPVRDRDYLAEKLFIETHSFTYLRGIQDKKEPVSAEEWAAVYSILELAHRRKIKWDKKRPQIEKWENLFAAPDASQVQVRSQVEGDTATPRWRTFGQRYSFSESKDGAIVPAEVGFAIASPLLALAEGNRTITLTVYFQEEQFNMGTIEEALRPPLPFRFLLSTAEGMAPVENAALKLLDPEKHALEITLTLDEQVPAVTALHTGNGVQSAWPVLQMMLADLPQEQTKAHGPLKRYRAFQHLKLEKIELNVDVKGLTQLSLQNDESVLDPKKPFEPFGMSPVSGSSFYFAHPELCSKKINELRLQIEWLGAPDDFSTYYQGYQDLEKPDEEIDPTKNDHSPVTTNAGFKADLKLHDRRRVVEIEKDLPLFSKDQNNRLPYNPAIVKDELTERDVQLFTGPEVLNWSRYWQLELLAPDFQHSLYPRLAAERASRPRPYILNPPYTPKIKRLTVGYTSALGLDLTKWRPDEQVDALYHLEPFGYRKLREAGVPPGEAPESVSRACYFLPQFENEGELFIGIQDLRPPQNLALLFQMAEGSADPNVEPEPVHWFYLDGDDWHSLESGGLLSDTTNGLLNSGVLRLDLPPVEASALLPAGLYWIRATIARNCRCVADVVAIQTQAVCATFEDHGNDPDRLAQPLPAESITALAEPLPQVKAIHQPFSSFGGNSPEQARDFYTRVSERLRHKDRALTAWDYEHLVLESFPSVYKVKCLPVGTSADPRLADVIQVIVIPNIRGKLPFDPFEPKLPADVLLQIERYLLQLCPPDIRLIVRNPTYVRLKVRLNVRLQPDANPGYFRNLINEELQRYLAPWAYDQSAEIVFGGRINTSLIINFLEGRPGVDYVAGLKLFTSLDGENFDHYDESTEARLDPDAILVSDRSHEIDLIAEEGFEQEFFTGIDYMKIELDFQIAAE